MRFPRFSSQGWLATAGLLATIWAVAVTPWLLGSGTIPYDAKDEFYPGVVFAAKSLLRGEAPLWNPFLYAGYPSFADPQAMTFSPSVALPMLLSQGIAWFDFVVLLHLLIGGIGMLRLGRSYAWTNGASLVAAMVFMFGGVVSSRLQHTPMIVTWAFLPWMFVGLRALFEKPTWRAVVGLGLALGLGVLQLTQLTYLSLLLVGAYATCRLIGTLLSVGWRPAWTIGARLVAAAALSLVIAAPQLIATLEVVPYTNRAILSFAMVAVNSLSPAAYLTLISPDALGNLTGKYVGPNDITETYFYLGAFPLAILLSGLLRRRQGEVRREMVFWTMVIALSVLYALGRATPVYAWLYGWFPGIQYFRRPTDAAFVFVFGAAILIGISMDAARAGAGARAAPGPQVGMLGAIVGLLLVAALSICAWLGTKASVASLALLGAGFVCYWRARTAKRPGVWIAALVLSVFIDLWMHNLGNRMNAHGSDGYRAIASLEDNPTMSFLAQRLKEDGYYRVELRTGAGELNAPETMGIASIGGLNPFMPKDYISFVGMEAGPLAPRQPSGAFGSYRGRINDLLGVRYLAADGASRAAIGKELGAAYTIVAEPQGRVVWMNPNALPRVLRPRHAIPAPQVQAIKPAMLDSIDLEDYAYVEAPVAVLAKCAGAKAGRADITRYSNNEIVIDVETDQAAWITLNDAFFDGWRAEISEEVVPIYRANGIFRAICVPPGRHSVRFVFEPYRHYFQTLRMTIYRVGAAARRQMALM